MSVLEIIDGKAVTVRMFEDEPRLCAVDYQNEAPSVNISRRDNRMALLFQHANKGYFLKVDGNSLMLEIYNGGQNVDDISDCCWFEKQNLGTGEHYGLRSVVEPRRYLSTSSSPKIQRIVLSEKLQECVRVRDRMI